MLPAINDPEFLAAALASPAEAAGVIAGAINAQSPAMPGVIDAIYGAARRQLPGAPELVRVVEELAGHSERPLGPQAVAGASMKIAPQMGRRPGPIPRLRIAPPIPERQPDPRRRPLPPPPRMRPGMGAPPNAANADQSAPASSVGPGPSVNVTVTNDGGAADDESWPEVPEYDDDTTPDDADEYEAAGLTPGDPPMLTAQIGAASLSQWLQTADFHKEGITCVGVMTALATAGKVPAEVSDPTAAAMEVYDASYSVVLTSHVSEAAIAALAKRLGKSPDAATMELAAKLRVSKLFALTLQGRHFITPEIDGRPVKPGQYSGALAQVFGIAPLGDYLKAITYHHTPDAWIGCVSVVVASALPAPGSPDTVAIISDGAHTVDLCMTVPLAALRSRALEAAPGQWVDDATITKAAQLTIGRIVANILRGEAFLNPLSEGQIAAGFDLWKDLVAPGIKGVASMVVGPAAADAAVNAVGALGGQIAKGVGDLVGGKKPAPAPPPAPSPGVVAIVEKAKAGDPAAQQAVGVLKATNDAKTKADGIQTRLEKIAAESDGSRDDARGAALQKAKAEGITINVGVPGAGVPVGTRYQPPPLAVAASGGMLPALYPVIIGRPTDAQKEAGAAAYKAHLAAAAQRRAAVRAYTQQLRDKRAPVPWLALVHPPADVPGLALVRG